MKEENKRVYNFLILKSERTGALHAKPLILRSMEAFWVYDD